MSLGISTSWNAFRHPDGKSIISEVKGLNFQEVELSFNLLASMVTDFEDAVKNNQIKVCSVHNFCPIPDNLSREVALPDYYSLASLDEDVRIQALKYTKRTIDTASRVGAKVAVLHAGRVEVEDRTRQLFDLYALGKRESPEFRSLINDILKERRRLVKPFFQNSLKSLEELNSYAQIKGVLLGVENRFYLREIPSFEEIGMILERFKGSNIFYWHDTGHAQLMQNLGLNLHEDFLKTYRERLIGMHIHDIIGCSDHQAPPKGDLDFNLIKPYFQKDTLKVLEVHYPASAKEILESKKFLEELLDGKI